MSATKGGFIIVDDYALPNCAAAVTDFRGGFGIDEPLIRIDPGSQYHSVYWRKMK
ncbi:TylF/MycF/NovP-related O-methyltransferase [Paenibacillus prosopidis]|uniref:TylF/MycF/NovP-related O-methyltransferase n=1 Tax=Paenibacillus prosopidis TaxID=630520 RepID=UPI000DF38828